MQYTQMQQIGIFISQHEMGTESMPETTSRKDFFISYTSIDAPWAEWIAAELEYAGYTTIIQSWDFRPGSNFLSEMDNAIKVAERTIAVLSPKYFDSDYTF